jgi:hypothetical protein
MASMVTLSLLVPLLCIAAAAFEGGTLSTKALLVASFFFAAM